MGLNSFDKTATYKLKRLKNETYGRAQGYHFSMVVPFLQQHMNHLKTQYLLIRIFSSWWFGRKIISDKYLWCLSNNKFWRNQGADAEVPHLFTDCIQPRQTFQNNQVKHCTYKLSQRSGDRMGKSLSLEAVTQNKRSGYWLIIWIPLLEQHGGVVLNLVNKGIWRRQKAKLLCLWYRWD